MFRKLRRLFSSSKPSPEDTPQDKTAQSISDQPGFHDQYAFAIVHCDDYKIHLGALTNEILQMTNLVPYIKGEPQENTTKRIDAAIALAIHEIHNTNGTDTILNNPDENAPFILIEQVLRNANQDPETSARWADSIQKTTASKSTSR